MKRGWAVAVLAFLGASLFVVLPLGAQEPAPAGIHNPYLGQKVPGAVAELFAPGVVSTGMFTRDVAMTPDGRELYFTVVLGQFDTAAILVTKEGPDGKWSAPEVCPFASDPSYLTLEPCISPDGKRFFFASNRPVKAGGKKADFNIWSMERKGDGWGEPAPLPAPVNSEAPEFFPSVTRWDTLYFTRENPDGSNTIYRSVWKDEHYQALDKLPPQVNCGKDRFNAFVAPDEGMVILGAVGLEGGQGGVEYVAVFRNGDDTWSGPVNLGPAVNTAGSQEYAASLSPDGKVLFFMSGRKRDGGVRGPLTAARLSEMHDSAGFGTPSIWWIDAAFLESLRPKKAASPKAK